MVFVVAEIGVNWDGNFDLAKSMMINAKVCGCNAVKFQSFNENIVKDHPEKSRLMSSSISEKNIEMINELAESVGIEWFCTPMYLQAVDMLEPYISRFKIREFDGRPLLEGKTTDLLERVLRTGKEIIVSSQRSPKDTKYFGHKQIKWLYVVPKYPCSLLDLDFKSMREFNGFSNHCPEIIAPVVASVMGAEIIEVHITSDKTKNFIDNNVSFDFKELKECIRLINLARQIKV
jgi:N,N'-diacetyllegionaminate synthase